MDNTNNMSYEELLEATTKLDNELSKNSVPFNVMNDDPHSGDFHYTKFKCVGCNFIEEIPTNIVMDFEFRDDYMKDYMPSFICEKCGKKMYPIYYKGYSGKIYKYKF